MSIQIKKDNKKPAILKDGQLGFDYINNILYIGKKNEQNNIDTIPLLKGIKVGGN
jgi:hypothetical protein